MTSGDEAFAHASPVDLRVVFDALVRAVVVTDSEGRVVLWNQAAERLYGWVEGDVLGRPVLEVLAPAGELVQNRQDLEMVAGGNSMAGERLVRHRDGRLVRVLTSTVPVLDRDDNLVGIVGSSEDVGELRIAEQHTRDLLEHFRSALEAGGLGTWRWDMATGQTVWDDKLESLFGLPVGGFDGSFEMYVSMLHPDDREGVLQRVAHAVDSKSGYRVEHRVVWPDGSVHWLAGVGGVTLDEHGDVTGTVGCTMDITDRVEQESERQRLTELAVAAASSERLQRQRLEFLALINDALNQASTIGELMVNVTTSAVPRLGDWCTIHVLPQDGRRTPDVEIAHVNPSMVAYARELRQRFPYDPAAPNGVPAVIRSGLTEFYPEISDDLISSLAVTDEVRELLTQLDLGSVITVAMKKRGRVLGALQFVASTTARRYTADDVALAETVAGRIASSIDNLRLRNHQRDIAFTLQRSLLPDSLPVVAGLDIAVRYWPNGEATEVGGDFYDMFALDHDGQFAVVLGDVCGTGPAAAALTGLARHTIRASAWHGDSPEEVLRALNTAVRRSGNQTFLTCVYATIDMTLDPVELTVACGGHPSPVRVGPSGTSTLGAPGTLLGALDDIVIRPTSVSLAPGDVVVFHTDGATDASPPHDLDQTEWANLVAQAVRPGGSAEQIADRVQYGIEEILPFGSRNDDIALLVLAVDTTRHPRTASPP